MPKALSMQDIEISMVWLEEMERAQITQVQMAGIVGLSESQFSRRMSLARRYRQEQDRRESGENDVDRPEIGDDDAEWLELVDQPSDARPSRGYYAIGSKAEQVASGQGDQTSLDGTGAFCFVGSGRGGIPRRNRLGSGKHVDSGQRYGTADDGLKGGKG